MKSKALRIRAREIIAASLAHAMRETESNQRSVAEQTQVKPITIHRWLARETAINVEAILAAPRLAKAFRRELCGEHHDEPAPYVARKRGAK